MFDLITDKVTCTMLPHAGKNKWCITNASMYSYIGSAIHLWQKTQVKLNCILGIYQFCFININKKEDIQDVLENNFIVDLQWKYPFNMYYKSQRMWSISKKYDSYEKSFIARKLFITTNNVFLISSSILTNILPKCFCRCLFSPFSFLKLTLSFLKATIFSSS